jgi:hypothetical protein
MLFAVTLFQHINSRLAELKQSWELSGCTVMSDGWTNSKGRTLLNFLVHCPRGTMFIKSMDASAHVKDATLLCELINGFIQEIGLHNVVQIIIDNAANYVVVGRILLKIILIIIDKLFIGLIPIVD